MHVGRTENGRSGKIGDLLRLFDIWLVTWIVVTSQNATPCKNGLRNLEQYAPIIWLGLGLESVGLGLVGLG